jgi:glycosyltransferase involved in cell wall biosynthesis
MPNSGAVFAASKPLRLQTESSLDRAMAEQVVLGWPISTVHGWGVYGLNLALNWATDPDIELMTSWNSAGIEIDPLRIRSLVPFLSRSLELQKNLQAFANSTASWGGTVLTGLFHNFVNLPGAHNVTITGKPTIGVVFFESALLPDAIERAKTYPCIVAGSTWNENVLRAYGVESVRTVLQGIDATLFHPGPKLNLFPDRFLIFSGGKAEYRKAQDIVLAAFKIFSERHPEAFLVTAWYNSSPDLIRSLDWSGLLSPVPLLQTNQIDLAKWANANGIRADRIIDLGLVPNQGTPAILREMNVALFPNRGEGGTNLVAMECLACGLPVILSQNTGHLDLVDRDNCYLLKDQRETIRGFGGINGVSGWGESQTEEIVERLEQVFYDDAEAQRRGKLAADAMGQLTWRTTARKMKDIVMEHRHDVGSSLLQA